MLDSGATSSVIRADIAKLLGLREISTGQAETGGGAVTVHSTDLYIRLPSACESHGIDALISDTLPLPFVLGMDFLRNMESVRLEKANGLHTLVLEYLDGSD